MNNQINNSFSKAIITLTSGAILGQIITFLASPIMTRIYSSEEIGFYTLMITVITIFGGVICGRYELSIITTDNEGEVFSLIKLSFIIGLLSSLLISIIYSVYYDYYVTNINVPTWVIGIIIFFLLFTTAIANILISYNNRNKDYKLIASVQLLRTFIKDTSMVTFGLLGLGSIGLMVSQVAGQVFGLNRQSKLLKGNWEKILRVKKKEMIYVAKLNKNQPIYSVPAIFFNNLSYSSLNLVIGYLFGLSALGFYALSFRVLGLPINVISSNVSKVYFERATKEYKNTNSYSKIFLKTSSTLIIFAILMVIILMNFAPLLFRWFFGQEWEIAGSYISILAPLFGVRLIVSALSSGVIISNKQHIEMFINFIFLLTSLVIFIVSYINNFSIEEYLYMITYSFATIYLVHFFILFNYSLRK